MQPIHKVTCYCRNKICEKCPLLLNRNYIVEFFTSATIGYKDIVSTVVDFTKDDDINFQDFFEKILQIKSVQTNIICLFINKFLGEKHDILHKYFNKEELKKKRN